MQPYNSGFVSLIGKPNVGKSTLLNRLIGEKIAIVTSKPQTTRNNIQGIITTERYQIIFVDTPGIHVPKTVLGEQMVRSAMSAMGEVDVILYLVEPKEYISAEDKRIIEKLKSVREPVILVINKADKIEYLKLLPIIELYSKAFDFKEIIPISALKSKNLEDLKDTVAKYLPEGPQFFPDDMITDQPERQIVAEMIREKALKLLQDELPHGIAIEIVSHKLRPDGKTIDITADIYCEKRSHKGMIIGKNGEMLQEIGRLARSDIERFLDTKVYLQLWVKVKEDWRRKATEIRRLGLDTISEL